VEGRRTRRSSWAYGSVEGGEPTTRSSSMHLMEWAISRKDGAGAFEGLDFYGQGTLEISFRPRMGEGYATIWVSIGTAGRGDGPDQGSHFAAPG